MVSRFDPRPSSGDPPQQPWQRALQRVAADDLADALAAEIAQRLGELSRAPTVTFGKPHNQVSSRTRRRGPVTVSTTANLFFSMSPDATAANLFVSIYPDEVTAARSVAAHRPQSGGVYFRSWRIAIQTTEPTAIDGWPARVSVGERTYSALRDGHHSVTTFGHCGITIDNAVVEGVGETRDQAIEQARIGLASLIRVCERLVVAPPPARSPSTIDWPDPTDFGLPPGFPQDEPDDDPGSEIESEESMAVDNEKLDEEDTDRRAIVCPFCGKQSCEHEVESWDDSVTTSSEELGTFFSGMSAALDAAGLDDLEFALPAADLHDATKRLLDVSGTRSWGPGWSEEHYLDWLQITCGVAVESQWWEGTMVSGNWHVAFHPSTSYLFALLAAVEAEATNWLAELMMEDEDLDEDEDVDDAET